MLNQKALKMYGKKRFEDIIRLFVCLDKRNKINNLLVSEISNPFHKIIMYSNHMNKAKVTSFNHGNDFGVLNLKWGINL